MRGSKKARVLCGDIQPQWWGGVQLVHSSRGLERLPLFSVLRAWRACPVLKGAHSEWKQNGLSVGSGRCVCVCVSKNSFAIPYNIPEALVILTT